MPEKPYKPEVRWDQSAFEALKATWSPKRIAEDEKRLQEIFDLAAHVPSLKEALDWANTHGIKFFVDHKAVNAAGYYVPGMGALAVVIRGSDTPEFHAQVITHEIRHAWQDYHGLLKKPLSSSFAEYNIKTALIEADAFAFGKRAAYELSEWQGTLMDDELLSREERWDEDEQSPGADLQKNFLSWFAIPHKPQFYGHYASKSFSGACKINRREAQTSVPKAFEVKPLGALGSGMDIDNIESVLHLGKGFTGAKNYLAALPREVLPKKILVPSLANTFWGAANDAQRKLTAELRKARLRKKLAHRLRKGEP
jgi:hypothetical protein